MEHGGERLVVAFNSAGSERLLDNLELGSAGATLVPLFDIDATPGEPVRADTSGRVSLRLPARGGRVYAVQPGSAAAAAPTAAARIDALPQTPMQGDFDLTGLATPGSDWRIVVDGDLQRSTRVRADAQGRFSTRVDTARMGGEARVHRVVAVDEAASQVSAAQTFRVNLPWRLLADVEDPAGDDHGPEGQYRYPTHESFAPGQMDIRRVRVFGAGSSLRVEVEMGSLSTVWGPANGFDHVAFSLFIELPGQPGGTSVMPGQNGQLPEGMRWHRRLRAHGWSNALFAPTGADAQTEGTAVTPAASITTDPARRTVSFTLSSAALGDPASLSGARLWLTTWDYDAGWRTLARDAGAFTFGAGAGDANGPKVMDASAVIRLP